MARGQCRHIAIVGETAADVRDVMVGDGLSAGEGSGILQVHPKDFRPHYEPSKRRLTWPNGAIATCYNATEPDQLRGPQHHAGWADELAKWQYAEDTWDNLEFGMRLGDPRICITTTPKPIKLLKQIIADPGTIVIRGSTYENRSNLSQKFLDRITKYEGTRLGRQEIHAELLDDVPGALWTRTLIDELRRKPAEVPELIRVVVAIDPPASSGEDADEAGIVCVGLGIDGHCYVLEDASKIAKPAEWAAEAIAIYKARKADRIVAEVNNGGEMVENTIRVLEQNISYKAVHASRGKAIRAEPISAVYEQKMVHHVGAFSTLEDQLTSFTPDFDRDKAGYSPDRLDALVWAITDLMIGAGDMVFRSDDEVLVDGIDIPRHWRRVSGLDITRDRVSVVWGAHDTANDIIYLYGEYSAKRRDMAGHAATIRDRGKWIPCVFEPKARERSEDEGIKLVERLISSSVDLFEVDDDAEAAIEEMNNRLSSKRLKAFKSLTDWTSEYRNYRRDKEGDLVEERDGLLRATGILCASGVHIAITDHAVDEDNGVDFARSTRSKVTGY